MIDNLSIEVDIDPTGGNVPMIHESACTSEEIKEIGPYMKSVVQQYERKTDFPGSWSSSNFSTRGVSSTMTNKNGVSFGLRNILFDENRNLTNPQKELLLWHHKLGISMQHIQQLMKVANVVEPSGRKSVKDKIIIPKYNSAATCDIPKCQSCEQAKAKQRKFKPTKSKAIKEAEGAIT